MESLRASISALHAVSQLNSVSAVRVAGNFDIDGQLQVGRGLGWLDVTNCVDICVWAVAICTEATADVGGYGL